MKVYFKHTEPKHKRINNYKEIRSLKIVDKKYSNILALSSVILLLVITANIGLFLYLTKKSETANEIATSKKLLELQNIELEGKSHLAESLIQIEQSAKLSGLTRNKSIKVIPPVSENVGLR
jgi:hypothetical protein